MKCKDATYTDLHRLVNAKLLKTKFFCPIPNCELSKAKQTDLPSSKQGLAYEQALNHQQTCLARPRLCNLGCGKKLMANEYEEHSGVCENRITLCPKCD